LNFDEAGAEEPDFELGAELDELHAAITDAAAIAVTHTTAVLVPSDFT
jgi:hypothetical protein